MIIDLIHISYLSLFALKLKTITINHMYYPISRFSRSYDIMLMSKIYIACIHITCHDSFCHETSPPSFSSVCQYLLPSY